MQQDAAAQLLGFPLQVDRLVVRAEPGVQLYLSLAEGGELRVVAVPQAERVRLNTRGLKALDQATRPVGNL